MLRDLFNQFKSPMNGREMPCLAGRWEIVSYQNKRRSRCVPAIGLSEQVETVLTAVRACACVCVCARVCACVFANCS